MAGGSRGHRPTCDRGKNHNEETEQQVCLDQCVLRDGCYKAGLAHLAGALQPRLVPIRVHEGGVHGPVQELLVEQDSVDVLHCVWTQNGCLDQKMAMRVQC